ncbi:MAG: citrate/2-methylcitrate synthase [Alphaproteobacteria bacterium]
MSNDAADKSGENPQANPSLKQTFTITDNRTNKSSEFPIIPATQGREGVDLSKLLSEFNVYGIAPGYQGLGAVQSSITYIDGDVGRLEHCGYPIEELAERSSTYLEVYHLLKHRELPTQSELYDLEEYARANCEIPNSVLNNIRTFSPNAEPMAILSSAMNSLSEHIKPDEEDKIIAVFPGIVANVIRHVQGMELMQANKSLEYTERFAGIALADRYGRYESNPTVTDLLRKLMIVHADHEQNASTTTVRTVTSTKERLLGSIAAGILALEGPAHGGAAVDVQVELQKMYEHGEPAHFIRRAKDKADPYKLAGFGHRIYKNHDPRAKVVQEAVYKLYEEMGIDDDLLKFAKKVEEMVLADPYFSDRKLYPNVDWQTGNAYLALGLPSKVFSSMFALGRVGGWIAQALEQDNKIYRPYQVYTGATTRPYVELNERNGDDHNHAGIDVESDPVLEMKEPN